MYNRMLYKILAKLYSYFLRLCFLFRKINVSSKAEVRISYANAAPVLSKVYHGGRVKLAFLNEVYPEQKSSFNVLYVVSSAMSAYTKEWFRLCKKSGVKTVWNQNGVGFPAWAGNRYNNINQGMAKFIHQADYVVYQSDFCRISSDKYLGKFDGPSSVIYNSVNTDIFIPKRHSISKTPVKLLTIGSHEQLYRVLKAIETLSALREKGVNAELNIAGRLTWKGAEEEVIGVIDSMKLNDGIKISGSYLQEDAPGIYQDAHVLLHFKYCDPCPTVIIEALSCGVPVISTRTGGLPELLGEEGGVSLDVPFSWDTISLPEAELIADVVIKIMDNWQIYSKKARSRAVSNFGKEEWLKKHKEIFGKVLVG